MLPPSLMVFLDLGEVAMGLTASMKEIDMFWGWNKLGQVERSLIITLLHRSTSMLE